MKELERVIVDEDKYKTKKLISIVCPIYNEENTIPIFYGRLTKVLSSLNDIYKFELIFTNNRSSDKSLEKLIELRNLGNQDSSIKILTMSRNFGYQASVQAGITFASGQAVIIIDVDCEDPPELIPSFLQKWEEGFDIVCGIRKDRPESWLMKKLRGCFYYLLRMTADMDIVLQMAEFGLVSSTVRDCIINNSNTYPFLRAEIGYAGFSRYEIPYDREPRVYGKTGYNLFDMMIFAAAGLLTSSTFLFRFAAYLLPIFLLCNIILAASGFLTNSLSILYVLIICNFIYITFFVTVHGVYIARIYKNVMGRPIYIIDPKLSFLNEENKKQNVVCSPRSRNIQTQDIGTECDGLN